MIKYVFYYFYLLYKPGEQEYGSRVSCSLIFQTRSGIKGKNNRIFGVNGHENGRREMLPLFKLLRYESKWSSFNAALDGKTKTQAMVNKG